MKKIVLDKNNIDQIINLYLLGQSTKQIGITYSLSGEYIRVLLKNNSVELRKYHQINRRLILNDKLFDNIDTEEKAYFLGILFADGNVHTKYNAITLKLQKDDKEILSKLSQIVYNKEILYKSLNNFVLKFSSKNIKENLIKLGCMPNKTFKLKFPNIDHNLYNHFIRGYFDGDGSIFSDKNDYRVNLISTNDFCSSIKSIIFEELGIPGTISKDKKMLARGNNITSILTYGGNRQIFKLMSWLYKDATIYMERKYKKYLELSANIEIINKRMASSYRHINQYM